MNTKTAYFNRFSIELPLDAINDCSRPGQNDESVAYWTPKILDLNHNWPSNNDIKNELKECGAWSEEDLEDADQNNQRIIWIGCHNIKEEMILEERLENCENEE